MWFCIGWVVCMVVKGVERVGFGVGGVWFVVVVGGLEIEGGFDVLWLFLWDYVVVFYGGSKMKSWECWFIWGWVGVVEWFCVGGWRDGEVEMGSMFVGVVVFWEGGMEEGNVVYFWDGGVGWGLWWWEF